MTLQDALRRDAQNALQDLRENHLVQVRQGLRHPSLYGFKYMPGADRYGAIPSACRGLVLDSEDNWEVVARPFDRVYNAGEPGTEDFDWATACITQKLDGSLIYVYRYNGELCCGTTGHPEAVGSTLGGERTFAELFWDTVKETNLRGYVDDNRTLMFELTTPENVHVIRQTEYRATLLAQRDVNTGLYTPHAELDRLAQALDVALVLHGYPRTVPVHRRLRDCLEAVELMEPGESEGFVVKDARHRMLKIKSPAYMGLYRLKYLTTPSAMIEAAKEGALGDVAGVCVEYLPEVNAKITEFRGRWDAMVQAIDACWQEWLNTGQTQPPNRSYAASVFLTAPAPAAMFALYDGKVTDAEEWLRKQSETHIRRLLNV